MSRIRIEHEIEIAIDPERDLHGPCVVRAGNGDLLLCHQDSRKHHGGDGFVRQWRSLDNGTTWHNEGPIVDWRDKGLDSLFGEYGNAPDGQVALIAQRREIAADNQGILGAWLYSSEDNGMTWIDCGPMGPEGEAAVLSARNVVRARDTMYVGVWSRLGGALYVSVDDGISWQKRSTMFPVDYPGFEAMSHAGPPYYPHVEFCSDGSLLAMTFIPPDKNICYSRRSHDCGITWGEISEEPSLPVWAPRLKRLDDEFLILTGRDIEQKATVLHVSTDGGRSWEFGAYVDRPSFEGSYAYTDTLSLGKGRFLVFTSSPRSEGRGDIVAYLCLIVS